MVAQKHKFKYIKKKKSFWKILLWFSRWKVLLLTSVSAASEQLVQPPHFIAFGRIVNLCFLLNNCTCLLSQWMQDSKQRSIKYDSFFFYERIFSPLLLPTLTHNAIKPCCVVYKLTSLVLKAVPSWYALPHWDLFSSLDYFHDIFKGPLNRNYLPVFAMWLSIFLTPMHQKEKKKSHHGQLSKPFGTTFFT